MPHMYILECADGTYYTGSTGDLERRLLEHEHGSYPGGYTARRGPVKLVHAEEFERVGDAWARERQVHGWSRAKKIALIEGRAEALRAAARRPRSRSAG